MPFNRFLLFSFSLLLVCILFSSSKLFAQNIFWTENFNSGCTSNCPVSSYNSPNGQWTVTAIGMQGAVSNNWFVSCAENNTGTGICSGPCGSSATLHIGENIWPNFDIGATYNKGGGFQNSTTNKRAESPIISTIGKTTITLSFLYVENGSGSNDDGLVEYSINGGSTWNPLVNTAKTTVCGSGDGIWTQYSSVLPTSCENIPNLKIGFVWINNNDGTGTDPSFAIDDMTLSTSAGGNPPVTDFSSSDSIICLGQCINFSDLSTNFPISWNWTFSGATPSSSTQQNPTNICYNTLGTFNVTLTSTNANGNDTEIKTNFITVVPPPSPPGSISGTDTVCSGQNGVAYSISSVSGATSYNWTIPSGAVIASGQGTTNITVNFGGISGNVCVSTTNSCGTSSIVCFSVYVDACGTLPVANFSASDTIICAGQCINFFDLSANSPISWNWTFNGATTSSSTQQNPTNICYNTPGTYSVTLIVTNANGSDTETKTNYITVVSLPATPGIISGADTVCSGQNNVAYSISPVSGVTSYIWTVPSGAAPTSGQGSTGITVNFGSSAGNICVLANNACGISSQSCLSITVNVCSPPVTNFSANDTVICAGQCVNFTDSSTNAANWNWTFSGAVQVSSLQQSPANICYNNPGTYNVTLIASNTAGPDTMIKNSYITVLSGPSVLAYPDTSVAVGAPVQLYASGGTSYSWAPATFLSSTNISNPVSSPTAPITYTVFATDANGCSTGDTVRIEMIYKNILWVPGAFSPNGDGLNDILFAHATNVKNFYFAVFNRWEEKVFDTIDALKGWNGNVKGEIANTGIFIYRAHVEFTDGTKDEKHGTVMLMK